MKPRTLTSAAAVLDAYGDAVRQRNVRRGEPVDGWLGEMEQGRRSATRLGHRSSPLADLLNPVHDAEHAAVAGPVWHDLAQQVRDTGLDAPSAVRAALAVGGDAARAPSPNELPRLFRTPAFANATHGLAERARVSLESQAHAAAIALFQVRTLGDRTLIEAFEDVLLSEQWALSPLFRFLAAAHMRHLPLGHVAATWRSAALRQYRSDASIYDAAWADLQPRDTLSLNGPDAPRHATPAPAAATASGSLFDALQNHQSPPGSAPALTSTGIPWLDELLGGGHAPGGVYGLLGPFGSCKTTVAVMLAVEAARGLQWAARLGGDEHSPGAAFFVSYEASEREIARRAISFAAMIDRAYLEDGLMDTQERRRFSLAHNALGNALQIVKPQPADIAADSGDSWNILSEQIAERCSTSGLYCRFVVIDYVGLMARFSAEHFEDAVGYGTHVTRMLRDAGMRARRDIAARFHCPVWLMQQLSVQANTQRAWVKLDGSDAAGSRRFADGLDAEVVVGRQATDHRFAAWAQRHGAEPAACNALLRLDGAHGRVVPAGADAPNDAARFPES